MVSPPIFSQLFHDAVKMSVPPPLHLFVDVHLLRHFHLVVPCQRREDFPLLPDYPRQAHQDYGEVAEIERLGGQVSQERGGGVPTFKQEQMCRCCFVGKLWQLPTIINACVPDQTFSLPRRCIQIQYFKLFSSHETLITHTTAVHVKRKTYY